jgi:16S rRNA (cytidine1402-2'-O)-methyltransferase
MSNMRTTSTNSQGTLYIVATPIGNLEDITLRALRTLNEVNIILAEDTRVTRKLLAHFKISTKVERFDAKVERTRTAEIVERLKKDENFALVTDAGTPGISDPGTYLVSEVHEHLPSSSVQVVPGPSALTAALSVAGVPTSEFIFLGFPPHKKGRSKFFGEIGKMSSAVIFYESSHRIEKALETLGENIGDRPIVLLRELTKIYEEMIGGTAQEVLDSLKERPERMKGEFVVIVHPK